MRFVSLDFHRLTQPLLEQARFCFMGCQKNCDKFLTTCYVLFMKALFHFSFTRARYARDTIE